MSEGQKEKPWFEMRDVIRPRLANGLWIPLQAREEQRHGGYDEIGHWTDFNGIRSLAAPIAQRVQAEKLQFTDLADANRSIAWDNLYIPVDEYRPDEQELVGVRLALVQSFSGPEPSIWTLHQDFVFALGLIREGDSWLRPDEGYAEVAQLRRSSDGEPYGLFVRPEFLRDYLAARSMALRIVQFRQRASLVADASPYGWSDDPEAVAVEGGIFKGSAWPRAEDTVAVFNLSRTDEFGPDELPVLGPPTDENTTGESRTFTRPTPKAVYVEGDFRRGEWVEPAEHSRRIRYDDPPSAASFIIDASGTRTVANDLKDEDIGRWLWFRPSVVPALLGIRGASVEWYTRSTGNLRPTPQDRIHFGINAEDLIVVYAYDIARLDEWQRVFWQGFNVVPSGGLPPELAASQVKAEPADTQAPEAFLARAFDALDQVTDARWGHPLFREHAQVDDILTRVHRFRSLDEAGFLALAKDLARLTADRFDTAKLAASVGVTKEEKLGSLKTLERALATLVDPEEARSLMGVLAGTYDLRLGDAHLPSKEMQEAMILAGIKDGTWLQRGTDLLHNVVSALFRIASVIHPKG